VKLDGEVVETVFQPEYETVDPDGGGSTVLLRDDHAYQHNGTYWVTLHPRPENPEEYFEDNSLVGTHEEAEGFIEAGASAKQDGEAYRAGLSIFPVSDTELEEGLRDAKAYLDSLDLSTRWQPL
jgi:hypothetical protein